ncbi:hypothetical protein C8R44DRAFT_761157 [Mycena epipterygia]|nr:hypothetical protein C8R44DRAFT_761157 [Mycena epipterygia]
MRTCSRIPCRNQGSRLGNKFASQFIGCTAGIWSGFSGRKEAGSIFGARTLEPACEAIVNQPC